MLGIQCKVIHWQLRDLLQVDMSTGGIYFTRKDTIRELRLGPPAVSRTHFDPGYGPRCFNTNDGATVTGAVMVLLAARHYESYYSDNLASLDRNGAASKGLFSFHHEETGVTKTGKLGAMINNAVTVKRETNGQYRAYVCNNDSNLYMVDIAGSRLEVAAKINCELNTSLNNVCQLPSNSLLIVTGDSPTVFVCDPKARNGVVDKICTDHDSGFGISHHSGGNQFAVTFQDGTCLVYDARNLKTHTHEIRSTRPGHQSGAFRTCKFSNLQVNDLLVVLEHVGRVHLVDLKCLNEPEGHQVIVFPFALDQFASYKDTQLKAARKLQQIQTGAEFADEPEEDVHSTVGVYADASHLNPMYGHSGQRMSAIDEQLQFTAPLVYDYDHVTNVKPKMFKNYLYTPPPPAAISRVEGDAPNFNVPSWDGGESLCRADECPEPTQRQSAGEDGPQAAARAHSVASPNTRTTTPAPSMGSHFSRRLPRAEFAMVEPPPGSGEPTLPSTAAARAASELHHDSYQQSYNHIDGEMELAGLAWYGHKLLIGCERGGMLTWDINQMARRSFGSYNYL